MYLDLLKQPTIWNGGTSIYFLDHFLIWSLLMGGAYFGFRLMSL